MYDFLKTNNGEREIDLPPSVAKMLREFIGERRSGLLFPSRTGRPLHQSDILRRVLHPILGKLGQPKCGAHAFRRFRNTYLRNYTSTPPGVYRFWMGHARADGETSAGAVESMSDRYDKAEHEGALRKEWAGKSGVGFRASVQNTKIRVIGPNGPKLNSEIPEEMAVSA